LLTSVRASVLGRFSFSILMLLKIGQDEVRIPFPSKKARD
jgi:hypothetical protein